MFVRRSIVTFSFAFLCVLGLCQVVESCKENSDCRNGYCMRKSGVCICNPGWWGNLCQFCRLRLTADSGLITDGDGTYASPSKCSWLIESQRANSTIILDFEEFATECNWDHLYIYDGKSVESPLIGVLSGLVRNKKKFQYSDDPLLKLQAKSGAAFLYFYSDKHYVEDGFQIKYRISQDCSAKCSFHGVCDEHNNCECDAGWSGLDCSIQTCIAECVNGSCDNTTRLCVCQPGFSGASCNVTGDRGYWVQYASIGQDLIQGRASYAAAAIGDYIWIYGGFSFNQQPFDDLVRYHIPSDSWEVLPAVNSSVGPARRYGHSMVVYNMSLIVFGGIVNKKATKELWSFDTQTHVWQLLVSQAGPAPLSVAGHTATIVDSKMIVLFGYGPERGFTDKVQEYDLGTGQWDVFEVPRNVVSPSYGHSSAYDPVQRLIYVHGGFTSHVRQNEPSNGTSAYHPINRVWYTLKSSSVPRFLHSAVILDKVMFVYGGNSHNGTVQSKSDLPCFSMEFLAYDLSCNEWKKLPESGIPKTARRYGHSAVLVNRTMYVFGGFRGVMLNDMLSFTPGSCDTIKDRNSCESRYNTSGCVWSEATDSCLGPEQCSQPQISDRAKCSEFLSCSRCTSSLHSCTWCGDLCGKGDCDPGQKKVVSIDKCPGKEGGCIGNQCNQPVCHNRTSCEVCMTDQGCMWCESQQQCVAVNAYPVNFPYGQCRGWVNRGQCSAVRCSGMKTCDDCHTLPGCGWCDDGSTTGLGQCMDGGDDGPLTKATNASLNQCTPNRWYFMTCPDCQCNGHSECINKNICDKCENQTDGPHCERCTYGHFGDAKNGGTCKACECNGHADTCDPETGVCECLDRWVTGNYCEKCTDDKDVIGNATDGGYCYTILESNFQFTFNVNKSSISFLYIPDKDDIDVKFAVSIKSGQSALLNVSVSSASMADKSVASRHEIGAFEQTFSHEAFEFGSRDKFTFKVHVFDIKGFTMLEISFIQRREFLILNFFITFFGCFFSLLFVVALAWKIKVRYSNFLMSRQRVQGMKLMARRPFAKVCLNVTDAKEDDRKTPSSSVAMQPCENHAAAVGVFMMRLPGAEDGLTPIGQSGLCCATVMGLYGEAGTLSHSMRAAQRAARKRSSLPKPSCI